MTATSTEGPLPPETEARLASFTELVATAIANAESSAEIAASRRRIVAASDDARRRIVRDLHDGAQQRLVHTVITLKLAQQAMAKGAENGPLLMQEAIGNAEQAMAEVRELAHGILPSVLTHGGLRAAVDALASRMPVPVQVAIPADRLPAPIEATAYFVVAEALTNVAKHAGAASAAVAARVEDGTLRVEVRDDGVGGARPRRQRPPRAPGPARRARRAPPDREPRRRRDAGHGDHPHPGKRHRAIGATEQHLRASAFAWRRVSYARTPTTAFPCKGTLELPATQEAGQGSWTPVCGAMGSRTSPCAVRLGATTPLPRLAGRI